MSSNTEFDAGFQLSEYVRIHGVQRVLDCIAGAKGIENPRAIMECIDALAEVFSIFVDLSAARNYQEEIQRARAALAKLKS